MNNVGIVYGAFSPWAFGAKVNDQRRLVVSHLLESEIGDRSFLFAGGGAMLISNLLNLKHETFSKVVHALEIARASRAGHAT